MVSLTQDRLHSEPPEETRSLPSGEQHGLIPGNNIDARLLELVKVRQDGSEIPSECLQCRTYWLSMPTPCLASDIRRCRLVMLADLT